MRKRKSFGVSWKRGASSARYGFTWTTDAERRAKQEHAREMERLIREQLGTRRR